MNIRNLCVLFLGVFLVGGLSACSFSSLQENETVAEGTQFKQPEASPDLRGTVKGLVGNEITISILDPESEKTLSENREKLRGQMQTMSQEERQSAMQEMQKNLKTVDKKIIFPVGIPMGKTTNGTVMDASLSDVKIGSRVTIWLDGEHSTSEKTIAAEVMLMSGNTGSGTRNPSESGAPRAGMGGGMGGGRPPF